MHKISVILQCLPLDATSVGLDSEHRLADHPPAMLQATGRSWLSRQLTAVHSENCPCLAHIQIVPRIDCGAAVFAPLCLCDSSSHQRCQQKPRTAAVICSVTSPTAPLPIEHEDPDPTKARLHALYRFVMDNGRLPQIHEQQEGVAVGHWAEQCRQQHQQQALNADLATALESITGWDWQPQTKELAVGFEEGIQLIQRYQQVSGGRLPRARAKSFASALEKDATAVCRQLLHQRQRGVLTQQQIDRISRLIPGWKWDDRVRAPPLDKLIEILHSFVEEHGRLPRLTERLPDGFLLGEWCTMRRSEYAKGELETDVAEALTDGVPGWSWNLVDTAFDINLEVLKQFVAEHHRIPAQRENHDGVRIGAWCNKRRLQYKQGKLPADRIAALEAVPGWWWTADDMPTE